jgi:NADH-quinone oxidoreductase subunit F
MIDSKTKLCELRDKWQTAFKNEKARILVCAGTGCVANGSLQVYEALKKEVEAHGDYVSVDLIIEESKSGVSVVKSGCHGFCEMGPLVRIEPSGVLYTKVKAEDAKEIVDALVSGKEPVERLLYHHPNTGQIYKEEHNIPFYKHQNRNSLAHCGVLDPEEIREYIAGDGYLALAKVLTEMKPEEVCQEIIASGLRGRGGGGFPTGQKWSLPGLPKATRST